MEKIGYIHLGSYIQDLDVRLVQNDLKYEFHALWAVVEALC